LTKKNYLDILLDYLKLEVYAAKDIKTPLLPCKYKGKTIFPTGRRAGIYLSEELKAVLHQGYQIIFLVAY